MLVYRWKMKGKAMIFMFNFMYVGFQSLTAYENWAE